MKASRGFTLVELLTVVTIMAVLVAILVPSLRQAMWSARKGACQGNVKGAVNALVQYAGEYTGMLPSRGFTDDRFDTIGADLTTQKGPVFVSGSWDYVPADSNSRNLFLAVRLKSVVPAMLNCPETNETPAGMFSHDAGAGDDRPNHDFDVGTDASYTNKLSYSYHLQFNDRSDGGEVIKGYPLGMISDTRMAVLADRSPFVTYPGANYMAATIIAPPPPATSEANSANHGYRGQNVGFLDGHVEWCDRPTAGPEEDNIYTVWDVTGPVIEKENGTIVDISMPESDVDSFLVP